MAAARASKLELPLLLEDDSDSLFLAYGFATPSSSRGSRPQLFALQQGAAMPNNTVGREEFVEKFLQMAEMALAARKAAQERLEGQLAERERQLDEARAEVAAARREMSSKVETAESRASEESTFLADQVSALLLEKQVLKDQMQALRRDREHLLQENALLRGECAELLEGPSPEEAAATILARQQQELQREHQASLCLTNENVQLRARVSALESALKAQQTSFVSCLEESERTRLQLELPDSPRGTTDWRHSEATEDALLPSYCSELEEASCSFSSCECPTPAGAADAPDLRAGFDAAGGAAPPLAAPKPPA
eukprot:scaffold3.g6311.t1